MLQNATLTDTQRLDHLEQWAIDSRRRGYRWNTLSLQVGERSIRAQLDEQISAAERTLPRESATAQDVNAPHAFQSILDVPIRCAQCGERRGHALHEGFPQKDFFRAAPSLSVRLGPADAKSSRQVGYLYDSNTVVLPAVELNVAKASLLRDWLTSVLPADEQALRKAASSNEALIASLHLLAGETDSPIHAETARRAIKALEASPERLAV